MSDFKNFEIEKEQQLFGQPIGLYVCFFTEMWERFSFYGMKALLLMYLVQYHLFSDDNGNLLVGSYAALVYAMPVIGGYLADKYLGFKKAVTFGAILLVLGHLGMAFEGTKAYINPNNQVVRDAEALQIFYFSLALIVVGVGFLKANISTIVGALYKKNDARRDSGFTIFYMGINLGSIFATLLCGWLANKYGWNYGFGAAGIGMMIGLITFLAGNKYFYGKADPKNPALLKEKILGPINREWVIYLASILGCFLVWQVVQRHSVVEGFLIIASIASLIFIIYYLTQLGKIARERLLALTILIFFSVVFWALFEQAYTSLTLFAERAVHKTFLGINFQTEQILSFNGIFIVLFAPVFAWIWLQLDAIKKNPNIAVKFALGLIFVGLGFGALLWGDTFSGGGKVALAWLVLCYLLHTFGELCLSPVGLSAVTKLSPLKIVGFMMGVWFLATAGSEYIAALLANLASIDSELGESPELSVAKSAYMKLFKFLFYAGIGFGLLLLIISPLLKKWMHGVDAESDEELETLETH